MPRKKPRTKAGKKAKMQKVMGEYKRGNLHSGSKRGPKVRSRKQAIAIGLSQSGESRKSKSKRSGVSTALKRRRKKK